MATKFTAKPDDLSKVDYKPPKKGWMDTPAEFKEHTFCWGAKGKNLNAVDFPNARDWSPAEEDWKLPENWQEIVLEGIRERLGKYRSFKLFMDICVRCGACADKCHFFIGGGDPKNMPVLRAELLRSIYRKYFTASGKMLGKIAGARELTLEVLKEIWYYYYQCTEWQPCPPCWVMPASNSPRGGRRTRGWRSSSGLARTRRWPPCAGWGSRAWHRPSRAGRGCAPTPSVCTSPAST